MITHDPAVRESYASDASGLHLVPDGVARPATAGELCELLREASASVTPVTVAGGQTSTTGASITDRGLLVSLRALDGILDLDVARRTMRVACGALLGDVKRAAAEHGLLFAPDPTSEEESTVGGAIACNASGARTLRYGATRAHVRSLRVALANGELIDVRRPGLEKNTAGYAVAGEPVDWFVGSEGTLGVVLEAELALLPRPPHVTGLAIPFAGEGDALAFVLAARGTAGVRPRCLEFFDAASAALFLEAGGQPHGDVGALVYLEEDAADADAVPLDAWLALAEAHGALVGGIGAYQDEAALRTARRMRHAVPATMNERGARCRPAGGRKVSTDWAVPAARLAETIAFARAAADRAGVEQAVIYGHAGNGHPHQNFIARDGDELTRVEAVVEETLRHVMSVGGTVSAEHGIGKLKRRWLPLQLSPLQLGVMRAMKRELDPRGILAPGNVL